MLTVTGANGCTSQASAVVESDLLAPDAFIGFFPELDCNIQSVALTGNSPQQGVTYNWSGPNGFTSADQTINVSTIGTYVLTVTGEKKMFPDKDPIEDPPAPEAIPDDGTWSPKINTGLSPQSCTVTTSISDANTLKSGDAVRAVLACLEKARGELNPNHISELQCG